MRRSQQSINIKRYIATDTAPHTALFYLREVSVMAPTLFMWFTTAIGIVFWGLLTTLKTTAMTAWHRAASTSPTNRVKVIPEAIGINSSEISGLVLMSYSAPSYGSAASDVFAVFAVFASAYIESVFNEEKTLLIKIKCFVS